jgi:predicted RNA-binding Zn-ribbon protein involved in translation (DUF1610 family)
MLSKCPGAGNIRGTPTLLIKKCPNCGDEIEIFSIDVQAACPNCGFIAFNDAQRCITWCRYAKECVGTETYERLVGNKEEE